MKKFHVQFQILQKGIVNLLREKYIVAIDTEKDTELSLTYLWYCARSLCSQLVDTEDKDDCTALHYAVEARCLPIVRLLVQKGKGTTGVGSY